MVIRGYGVCMNKTPDTIPNSNDLYKAYRAQGFTQHEANRRAIQDMINYGVASGKLQSEWADKKKK